MEKSHEKDPIIFNLSCCRYKVVEMAGRSLGWRISKTDNKIDNKWTVFWMDKSSCSERVSKLYDFQRINHFPYIDEIGRKHKLSRNMERMNNVFNKEYEFYPKSFQLPHQKKQFYRYVEKNSKKDKKLTFIVKPNGESCGRGIFLTQDESSIEKVEKCIVQQYITNPLLLEGRKFDLRVYCLVRCVDPLTLYIYQEGIVRICAEKWVEPNRENLKNKCMHFTNYTVNKKHKDFVKVIKGKYDVGFKRSFEFLRKWIRSQNEDDEKIFKRIEEILIKTLIAAQPKLKEKYHNCMVGEKKGKKNICFELLGFDIIFDDKFKPWLLEVNHSPSYNTTTPFDLDLKLPLIKETLGIIGIDNTQRKKSLTRSKLKTIRRIKQSGNDDLSVQEIKLLNSAHLEQYSNEKDNIIQSDMERKHLKKFKRIYPLKKYAYMDFFMNQDPLQNTGVLYKGSATQKEESFTDLIKKN